MEYFENGHLTVFAFKDLGNGRMDEAYSLKAAEHLAVCDKCIDKYAIFLANGPLMPPVAPIYPQIEPKIKNKARSGLFNRYITVAAAACFAFFLWVNGTFTKLPGDIIDFVPKHQFEYNTGDFFIDLADKTNSFFNGFLPTKGVVNNE